jgi:hypothetical protein
MKLLPGSGAKLAVCISHSSPFELGNTRSVRAQEYVRKMPRFNGELTVRLPGNDELLPVATAKLTISCFSPRTSKPLDGSAIQPEEDVRKFYGFYRIR